MSTRPARPGIFAEIRAAARSVAEDARYVRIDETRLESLALELKGTGATTLQGDPAHGGFHSPHTTLAFVVTLDAINFGSGWFPALEKRPGCSGYFTIAGALREHFELRGAWTAEELVQIETAECTRILGQTRRASDPDVQELMGLFARALRELGSFLVERFNGEFEALVSAANHRAEALVRLLAEMPLYRDVAQIEELTVPFYKRAQITVMDLAMAFDERGLGHFEDLNELTIFADNLVPHVLRCEGVLRYDDSLARRIDGGELLVPSSREEVEIRAVAVHVVERMAELLRTRDPAATPSRLDQLLWNRGQHPSLKARPRHRCRTPFY